MNKLILSSILCLGVSSSLMAGSVEQYVKMVGTANSQFQQSSRHFFNALNPQQKAFTSQQEQQYCQIVQQYVDHLYGAVEKNLDIFRSQKTYSKADVINEVLSKREMQTLAQYGVSCSLK